MTIATSSRKASLDILRAFCAIQVFMLHYCAGHYGKDTIVWFCTAVPTFLLMSAYLYGTNGEQRQFGKRFLWKRFVTLSSVLYPFLLATFASFLVLGDYSTGQLLNGLFVDMLYMSSVLHGLPQCAHLWFMTDIAICYFALFLFAKNRMLRSWMTSPLAIALLLSVVALTGLIYRGGGYLIHLLTFCYSLMLTS